MNKQVDLESIFKTNNSDRDKFLSRLFGIFNEEIIRIWCRDSLSPYVDIGRPSIYTDLEKRPSTLDFCLQNQKTGKLFISEMKCEIQYQNYNFLTLTEPSQLNHHKKRAFDEFLITTKNPDKFVVKVGGKQLFVNGGILVWGCVSETGRTNIINKFGFADILSVETIIGDLISWDNQEFKDRILELKDWCNHLFDGLCPE